MPRRRTVNLNLPEGMRARTWSSGRTYYYLEAGGKTTPLGPDYLDALRRYCDLVKTAARPAITWLDVVKRYQVEAMPAKARKTQIDEISRLKRLNLFFAEVPTIDQIEPRHLRQYQQWRLATKAAAEAARRSAGLPPTRAGDGKVAVNREITLFSTIWQFARRHEFTAKPCPAADVERFPERGRKDIYTEDDILAAVMEAGDQPLRDALDLAYLTGQRRADVLAMTEAMIRPAKWRQEDGSILDVRTIPVRQEKTGNKVRMILDGELGALVDRIIAAKRSGRVISLATTSLFAPRHLKFAPSHVAIIAPHREYLRWWESTTFCDEPCLEQLEPVSGVQVHEPDRRVHDYVSAGGMIDVYRLNDVDSLESDELDQLELEDDVDLSVEAFNRDKLDELEEGDDGVG